MNSSQVAELLREWFQGRRFPLNLDQEALLTRAARVLRGVGQANMRDILRNYGAGPEAFLGQIATMVDKRERRPHNNATALKLLWTPYDPRLIEQCKLELAQWKEMRRIMAPLFASSAAVKMK